MPSTRLIASALAACLTATPVLAQNTTGATPDAASASPQGSDANQMGSGSTSSGQAGSDQTSAAPATASSASGFRPLTPSASTNIIAELQASGEFTTLLKALTASNLTSLIQTHPNLTLIAPTDTAFAALPPSQVASLMTPANAAQLQALLTYHLINAKVAASDVEHHAAGPVPSVANKPVTFDGSGPVLKINGDAVLQSGVATSNGVIYVVGKVLTPPA